MVHRVIKPSPTPDLVSLARDVLRQTEEITKYLEGNGFSVPLSLQGRRAHLKPRKDLTLLADGPKRFWRQLCGFSWDLGAFQVALDSEFFTLIPAVDRTERIVRQLIAYGVFAEHEAGMVSHPPASLAMQGEEFRCFVHYSMRERLKSSAANGFYLQSGSSEEANGNQDSIAKQHGTGAYEQVAKDPEHSEIFARAMAGWKKLNVQHNDLLQDSFDRANRKGTAIDVGGSNGHISRDFARRYPHLTFIVQDTNRDMLRQGAVKLTDDIRDRVSFMEHSFFESQPPIQGVNACAFLLQQCAHNWAGPDVVAIFKALVSGLESAGTDTPLLINEIILPGRGEWSRHQERLARQMDIAMMAVHGAKERTRAELEALLKEADPRYEIRTVFDDGPLGVLELAMFLGDAVGGNRVDVGCPKAQFEVVDDGTLLPSSITGQTILKSL
ncbi:hypothetical protein PG996_011391 [Apiospora saccharicola]|uniref:O-methyltransferase C-terminal domain-containing protein n=1 Tax=Apiospora saccharicola TaxID=335842 RepID=A0ABR1UHW4_9PEZI